MRTDTQLNLDQIMRIVWLKKFRIFFLSLGLVAGALLYDSGRPVVYEARVLLQSNEGIDILDSRVATYGELMNTMTLATYIAPETGSLELRPEGVLGRADVEYVSGTMLFHLKVSDTHADRAVALANASANGLVKYLTEKAAIEQQTAQTAFEGKVKGATERLFANTATSEVSTGSAGTLAAQRQQEYWDLYSISLRRQIELDAGRPSVTVIDRARTAHRQGEIPLGVLALSAFLAGLVLNSNIYILRERYRVEPDSPEGDGEPDVEGADS